jgi:DNA-binding response OmpR family regulator
MAEGQTYQRFKEALIAAGLDVSKQPTHAKSLDRISDRKLHFGEFSVDIASRRLLRAGDPIEIGGRAFDLLVLLLEADGCVVSKNEIMQKVWPSMVVEESNLRFQVGALRKVLGRDGDLIKTVVRRGYLLVGREAAHESPDAICRDQDVPVATPSTTVEYGGRGIVLIEDDSIVRDSIEGLLRSTGLQVESFSSVKSFQECNRLHYPECLILDVWLPEKSGLEFQRDLANAGLDFPIIFISGYADIPMSVQAMRAGAIQFLTKPVPHRDLLEAINEAIALSANRHEDKVPETLSSWRKELR